LLIVVIPQPEKSAKGEEEKPTRIIEDVKFGFRYLVSWKGMFYLALAATLLNFLLNPGFTFTPLLVTEYFGKGAIELSAIESAFSAGMILGGMVLSTWGGFKKNIITTLLGILGLSFGTIVIALTPPHMFYLAVAGMAITGFMQPMANGPLFAIMQGHVDAEIQGRVFSMLESMVSAMMPISMLIAAPVAEWIGIRGWLMFGAAGCLVIGAGGFFIPALMNIEEKNKPESRQILEQENS
jgi:DHA3 family macrolide efflux protein-like MFS transporter